MTLFSKPTTSSGTYSFGTAGNEVARITSSGDFSFGPVAASKLHPIHVPADNVSQNELDSGVFNTPIDRLCDLWTARFGNGWVNLEDIEGDDFYCLAYKRLKSLGKLETHYLTDRARYVCRIPE